MKRGLTLQQILFVCLIYISAVPLLISCSKKNIVSPVMIPPIVKDSVKTYLALGDSYTIGQSVSEPERFPNQTVSLLQSQGIKISDPRIIATTGWTTKNLLDAINATSIQNNYDAVSLLIGVNNQYQRRSIEEYKTEFTSLLNRAIQFADNKPGHVFVLSIPDYSVTPFANGSDKAKIAAEIDQFNAANKAISLQLGVNYIDITPISRTSDPSFIAYDGLHPSGKQYKKWVELLAAQIIKIL